MAACCSPSTVSIARRWATIAIRGRVMRWTSRVDEHGLRLQVGGQSLETELATHTAALDPPVGSSGTVEFQVLTHTIPARSRRLAVSAASRSAVKMPAASP
jgi:hypothetical protein